MHSKQWALCVVIAIIGLALLAACEGTAKRVEVTTIKEVEVTRIVTEKETVFEPETIIVEVTPISEPLPVQPRTLVICQGEEPATLYVYDNPTLAARNVQEAIYDGPIDARSFGYQAVILEKLPSLADGDAVIEIVTVETGDLVVDASLNVVTLEQGVLVRPAGCYANDCAVPFDGSPLEMEQLEVTFRLREGMLWADGEPLTAYDSVYSFDLLKDLDTPADRYTTDRTASYEAIDDNTAVWTGLPGFRAVNYQVNFWHPLPEHAWGDFTALELIEAEESSRRPIGWGPYAITEWVAGDHITLEKNVNYWRVEEGLPKFDTVIVRFVGQNSEANIAAILAEKCDIVDQTVHLEDQSNLLSELEAVGKVNAAFVADSIWEHVDFGINPVESYQRPDFFEDVRVRQAVATCMDRQEVVDEVMFGASSVLHSYLPPEHPLYNPNVAQYVFDVNTGSALLEEVGWIDDDGDPATPRVAQAVEGVLDGTPLEFNYAVGVQPSDSRPSHQQQAAQLLQASLAECGIKVNLDYRDPLEYFAAGPEGPLFGRSFDISQFAWIAGAEPRCDRYLSNAIPSEENGWESVQANVSGYSDEAYDAACSTALMRLPGQPEYEEYHLEAQRIFAEQLPVVPLYQRLRIAATRPDMEGFYLDPTASEMWNIEAFDY